jgi:outer membrane protein assembly factor BamB
MTVTFPEYADWNCVKILMSIKKNLILAVSLPLILIACASQPAPSLRELPPALVWQYDSGGAIDHPPLRTGNTLVFVPKDGLLTALDAQTGDLRWQFSPPEGIWHRAYAMADEQVFIAMVGGNVAALDAQNGDLLWETALGINAQVPLYVLDQTLFVATTFVGPGLQADPQGQAKLFALDTRSGAIRWEFESENYILQTPFSTGEVVYTGGSYVNPAVDVDEGGPMRLYALSAADGRPLWEYVSEDGFVKAVYATDEMVTYIAYQDFLSGVDAQTGTLAWRGDTGNWVPSLAGSGNTVYYGSANTVVHAWQMDSGESLWTYNIGGESFNYLLGAPVIVGETVYFISQRGDMIALDANDGRELWRMAVDVNAPRVGLTVANDWIYIGDADGVIYAYTVHK